MGVKPVELELLCAYLLDRADQYKTSSPCWVAITDCVKDLMDGTAQDRIDAGEVDDLVERVRSIGRKKKTCLRSSMPVVREGLDQGDKMKERTCRTCGTKIFDRVGKYCDSCGIERIAELEAKLESVRKEWNLTILSRASLLADCRAELAKGHAAYAKACAVLEECGTNTDNPDTCGVCGAHFRECEAEKFCDEELDGTFVELGFSCPGARARELLKESA